MPKSDCAAGNYQESLVHKLGEKPAEFKRDLLGARQVAKKAAVIDDFLTRRNQLKALEEKRIEAKKPAKQAADDSVPAAPGAGNAASAPGGGAGAADGKVKNDDVVDVEGDSDTKVPPHIAQILDTKFFSG